MLEKFILVFLVWKISSQKLVRPAEFSVSHPENCPDLVGRVYPDSRLGNVSSSAGVEGGVRYTALGPTTLSLCVSQCCDSVSCDAALLARPGGECHLLHCSTDQDCLPVLSSSSSPSSSLVLVRPQSGLSARSQLTVCEVGLDSETCSQGEFCKAKNDKSRNGVCQCKDGATRDSSGSCVTNTTSSSSSPPSTASPVPAVITVSVRSETVQLPQSSASLTVYTSPQPSKDSPYSYEWKLLKMPDGGQSAEENNKNTETLTLSNLQEGVYEYKVMVTRVSPPGYGEARGNVTVLPPHRDNSPPVAVVVPVYQSITLPTNKAIIDGSSSTDDLPLTKYRWEVLSSPVGYQAQLEQKPTITLTNLTTGNYTVKMTVTDEDGASDTAEATIEVLKDTDYKPKAVAGDAILLYLPNNNVTLNGNKSYDDHKIVSWEWTKVKGDDGLDLPADIAGARTPFMTVSNLLQGQYTFLLKVTDEAGQSDEDKVVVYVKPPTNLPPKAEAGPDQELSLPISFVSLDGSRSKDDGNISSYRWSVQSGPPGAAPPVFSDSAAMITNVTGLTIGSYTFQLEVKDNSLNTATDQTQVTVKQDTNQAPVSKPGPNIKIVLPTAQAILDGSGSSDDLAIESWLWTRDPDSLAGGDIVGNWTSSHLVITNLVPGSYSFSLQVSDGQGKTDSKSTKISVLPDPDFLNVVEVVLNKNISHFYQKQKSDVLERIRVLTKGKGELSVGEVSLSSTARSQLARLEFKVFSQSGSARRSLPGLEVVSQLRRELEADPELLGVPVISVDTVVCQNTCGGHGRCDQTSRQCICQPAWMENFISRRLMAGQSNCDWSLVYVGLFSGSASLLLMICCCMSTCKRKIVKIRSKTKYRRLNTTDTMELGDEMETSGTLIHSDSDSEEEILFESAKKGRRLNGSIPRTGNGLMKNSKLNT